MINPTALLLLGPTGSGKTPLGSALQSHGIADCRCFHFDFGQLLRDIDTRQLLIEPLSHTDKQVIHDALHANALLECENFHIAATILHDFMDRHQITPSDLVILNGLPRHADQARDVDQLIKIKNIIVMECDANTVARRITQNSGGDRADRSDDSLREVENKLEIYNSRTRPLIEHYENQGANVIKLPIKTTTEPSELVDVIEREI